MVQPVYQPTVVQPVQPARKAEVNLPGQDVVNRVLTPEEQREVAFKVVAFFIMLIIGSFALLYIYHSCSQSGVKSLREKKTL